MFDLSVIQIKWGKNTTLLEQRTNKDQKKELTIIKIVGNGPGLTMYVFISILKQKNIYIFFNVIIEKHSTKVVIPLGDDLAKVHA